MTGISICDRVSRTTFRLHDVDVRHTTVASLKQLIAARTGTAADHLRLAYCSATLQDSLSLADYQWLYLERIFPNTKHDKVVKRLHDARDYLAHLCGPDAPAPAGASSG